MQREGKKKKTEVLMFSREVITPCGRGDGDCCPPGCSETFIVVSLSACMTSQGRMDWPGDCSMHGSLGHQAPRWSPASCGWSLLGQYMVFSVLILMQLGGCTWRVQGSHQAEGGHYFPVLGPARLCGEGCAQTHLRGAQPKHKRQQTQVLKREILIRHSEKLSS